MCMACALRGSARYTRLACDAPGNEGAAGRMHVAGRSMPQCPLGGICNGASVARGQRQRAPLTVFLLGKAQRLI